MLVEFVGAVLSLENVCESSKTQPFGAEAKNKH